MNDNPTIGDEEDLPGDFVGGANHCESHGDDSGDIDKAELPGIIRLLGEEVITEEGLARLFGRCPTSVKRAVTRGELPPPVKMFGRNTWTARVLIAHIEERLDSAREEAEHTQQKVRQLRP